jgi:dihydropteroate synthase
MQIFDIEKLYYPLFVTEHNPQIIDIKTLNDAKNEIQKIGSDPQSIEIMAPKAISKVIKLENVVLQDAIIIKQDMLSIGGEVAVPKNTFELHKETGDILVIGTIKQLNDLVQKLKRHYTRLKNIAEELEVILKDVR